MLVTRLFRLLLPSLFVSLVVCACQRGGGSGAATAQPSPPVKTTVDREAPPVMSPEQVERTVEQKKKRDLQDQEEPSEDQERTKTIEEALSDPLNESPVPIRNESLFTGGQKRTYSPEERLVRKKIANALWQTPLGQMYLTYLTDPIDRMNIVARGNQIVDRVFSSSRQAIKRVAALQILTEDAYVSGYMTEDALDRLAILEGQMSAARLRASQYTPRSLAYQAAIFFVSSLPFGSPIVRQEGRKVLTLVARNIRSIVRLRGLRGFERHEEELALRRLLSKEVFNDYELSKSVSFFFGTFGPFSMVYILWAEWSQAVTGQNVRDSVMLFGLDDLTDLTQF